jgi:hypothetical protein
MVLPDVNVLVYAFREESPNHLQYHRWLGRCLEQDQPFGMNDWVLASFVRLVTNARVFHPPCPPEQALAFAELLRGRPNCVLVSPGARHWEIFARLCRESGVQGDLIADAWLAALAIEHGCEWISADRGFKRFRGLRWQHPLEE